MKNVLKGIGIFFSVIISIILFSMLLITIIYNSFKDSISVKSFESTINNISASELVNLIDDDDEDFNKFLDDTNLSKEDFTKIIDDKETRKLVIDYLYGVEDYFKTGKTDKFLSSKELDNYLDNTLDTIIEKNNIELSSDDITNLKEQIKTDNSYIYEVDNNKSKIDSNIDSSFLKVINIINTDIITGVLIFVIIILILLIMLFTFSYYRWMIYAAITFILSSFVSLSILKGKAHVTINNKADKDLLESCLNDILNNARNPLLKNSLFVLAVGLVLLGVYILIIKNINDNKNNQVYL